MKSLISLILLALLPVSASAYDAYMNGFFYNLSGDEASVTYKYYDEENLTYDAGYSGNVVIPSSFTYNGKTYAVTGIGGSAFNDCTGLTSVIIPESVKTIGGSAFKSCNNLTTVTIPNSVTSISGEAFRDCRNLTSVTIGNGVTSLVYYTFGGCSSLTAVTIPDNVTSIGEHVFEGCFSLASVTIPDGVTSIDENAFNRCTSLTSVTIPGGVKNIGNNAFSGCTSLTSLTIDDGVKSIGEYAFSSCTSLTSVIVPESVTNINASAFRNCTNLLSVTVPENITAIGQYAFDNTAWFNKQPDGLIYLGRVAYKYKGEMPEGTEISIREETVQIAGEAFRDCTGLTYITIPDGITVISSYAFAGCKNLDSITIPESVTSIASCAFGGCSSLMSITIPSGVTNIDAGVFNGCTNLTSVIIPDGVKSIDNDAFGYCYSLTSITIPESLTNIGGGAFFGCKSLTSFTIPNGVTSIGFAAFSTCEGLKSITISNSVNSIDKGAFAYCSSLTDVFCLAENVPETGRTAFNNTPITSATLHVPAGSVEKYQKSSPWSGFGSIVTMTTESVTFTKDQMATIILPTAPDASKGKYYKLDRCEDRQIIFKQEPQPQARTPYIIVPNEDFSIDMSTLDVAGLSPDTVTVGGISFIGSYVRMELPALTGGDGGGSSSSYYDIIDQTPDCLIAQISTEMSVVGALRAYLVVTWDDPIHQGPTKGEPEKLEIVLHDDETSIGRPTPDPSRNGGEVYDLSGRRVGNGKWIMDDGKLKSGIYVNGGKKVLRRAKP